MASKVYVRRRRRVGKATEGLSQLQFSSPSIAGTVSLEKGKSPEDNEIKDKVDCASVEEEEEEDYEDESEDGSEIADEGVCERCDRKETRNEKKSRKLMLRMGMKPVSGVHHVTAKKKDKTYMFTSPTVFKSPTSETYVIYGQALIWDEKVSNNEEPQETPVSPLLANEVEEVDESGMDPMDIELVMNQTGLSWAMAAKALRDADNDIVTAIMEYQKFWF